MGSRLIARRTDKKQPGPLASLAPAWALLGCLAVSGCGTTHIYTTEPGARVLADGRALGRGTGELTRRGFPGSTKVVVKTEDGRQGETVVRREFTALTLVLGFVTYGVCLLACWEYPDTVFVPLPGGIPTPGYGNTPAAATVDPWLQPPPDWPAPTGKVD